MHNHQQPVIIIGAGMAGLGAAGRLQKNGFACTILEAQPQPGGLAGFFSIENKFFPLGYHHILYNDRPLIATLKTLGLYDRVAWKKGKVLFAINNRIYNLANPLDFVRFPLPGIDKLRFVKLMGYCLLKQDWNSVHENALTWLNRLAGPTVRSTIFDPLMDIKYGLTPDHLSASWIGSRLHYQEFSKPLGYIPGTDWTKLLVDKLVQNFESLGGKFFLNATVQNLRQRDDASWEAEYRRNGVIHKSTAAIVVNTAPAPIFSRICPTASRDLNRIVYLDALSLILETKQKLPTNLYMLACLKPRYSFGGIFDLSSLNATIGTRGGTVLNFFSNLSPRYEHLRGKTAAELLTIYQDDFQKLFGFRLQPLWYHLTLIKNYSPQFLKDYQSPPHRGPATGLYFAGNYLTHPAITSTGSALASGETAAGLIAEDYAE